VDEASLTSGVWNVHNDERWAFVRVGPSDTARIET
jgi:hypothetical protein